MQRFTTVLLCILLAYCAGQGKSQYDYYSEEQLYDKARRFMVDGKFSQSADLYQMLETRYPFGQYAEQSQLEIITAYYQAYDYELAIASADRFIRLHPEHSEIDFAYYYRGLSRFDMNRGVLDKFFNLDLSKRDPGIAVESFNDFSELITRYPESRFAADSRGRMRFLRNLMARHEVHVANYYFKRGAYAASANRGKYVIENFQESPAVSDGLAIMVQAYLLLDLPEPAEKSLTVLKTNFPGHEALNSSGNFNSEFKLEEAEESRLKNTGNRMFNQPNTPSFDNRL
jgi:outer membrane protein assembly factor BamD